MKTIKGPGIFLAQFIGERPPFNTLEGVAKWAAEQGYKALQIPCNHKSLFDVEQAAVSQAYCDDIRGMLAGHGLVISELSTHLEGQLVAVHPAYDDAFDGFAGQTGVGHRNLTPGRCGFTKTGADGTCHVFRFARMAFLLPVATA